MEPVAHCSCCKAAVKGTVPDARLHGCSEETSADIPCLAAGCLDRKRQEGPVLHPVLWTAQKVGIFTLFSEEQD